MHKVIAAALLALLMAVTGTPAAELRLLISNGLHSSVAELAPEFERSTGHKLSIRYDTAAFLQRDILGGEAFDVTVMTGAQFDAVANARKIVPDTRTVVALSGIGVAVRKGAPKPDISTVATFMRAMLAAKSIAYATAGTSGVHFLMTCERLGIADLVKAKSKTMPGGFLGELVAKGEAELVIQQISELLLVEGIELVGPFPPGLQLTTRYTAGVAANSKERDAGKEFIKFLGTPESRAVLKAKGLEPS
jgi:molybdate transport system substrate-binding protein